MRSLGRVVSLVEDAIVVRMQKGKELPRFGCDVFDASGPVGRPVGRVVEYFGPTKAPFVLVRRKDNNVGVGQEVFCDY